jgi:hypothetical protein
MPSAAGSAGERLKKIKRLRLKVKNQILIH